VREISADLRGLLLQDWVRWGYLPGKVVLMLRGAADDRGGRHGDADRPADVAEHVEEAGCVAHLFARERAGGKSRQRDEHKAQREAGEQDRHQQGIRADSEVDRPEIERADAEPDESGAEELAVVHVGAQKTDHRRTDKRADAAGPHHKAGGVAENLLVVERQDGDGDVDAHA